MTTLAKWTALLNKHLPIEVYFEETDMQSWADKLVAIPGAGLELAEMWNYVETVGYFGGERGETIPITKVSFTRGNANVNSTIVTSQQYCQNQPSLESI